jgi:hypothetical protein
MAEINVGVWLDNLNLAPGKSGTWFEDDVFQSHVRWFTAVPIGFTGIDVPFARNDQIVEITEVFHILKGDIHNEDGSGGARTLQVNVTVRNRDQTNAVTFRIYKAETTQP